MPGSTPNENKSLLLASGNEVCFEMNCLFENFLIDEDNLSTVSGNQNSSNEDLDEVEDKMPEISTKKVRMIEVFCFRELNYSIVEENRYNE
jgi:hypothetical protein